jgi:hypothetical protein
MSSEKNKSLFDPKEQRLLPQKAQKSQNDIGLQKELWRGRGYKECALAFFLPLLPAGSFV